MGATLSLYTDYVFFVPVKCLHVWKIGPDLAFTLALPASEAVGKENLCSQLTYSHWELPTLSKGNLTLRKTKLA